MDRAKDIDRAISDLKFIKKKLDEFNMSRNNKTI